MISLSKMYINTQHSIHKPTYYWYLVYIVKLFTTTHIKTFAELVVTILVKNVSNF